MKPSLGKSHLNFLREAATRLIWEEWGLVRRRSLLKALWRVFIFSLVEHSRSSRYCEGERGADFYWEVSLSEMYSNAVPKIASAAISIGVTENFKSWVVSLVRKVK